MLPEKKEKIGLLGDEGNEPSRSGSEGRNDYGSSEVREASEMKSKESAVGSDPALDSDSEEGLVERTKVGHWVNSAPKDVDHYPSGPKEEPKHYHSDIEYRERPALEPKSKSQGVFAAAGLSQFGKSGSDFYKYEAGEDSGSSGKRSDDGSGIWRETPGGGGQPQAQGTVATRRLSYVAEDAPDWLRRLSPDPEPEESE